MRETKRNIVALPRGRLRRAADGRLRPASEERDIADIWAERDRIRLAEAIAEQKRIAAKKKRRQERGLFGWRQHRATPPPRATVTSKEIEIKISLPKVDLTPVHKILRRTRRAVGKLSIKQRVAAVLGVGLVVFVFGAQGIHKDNHPGRHLGTGAGSTSAVAGASAPVGGTQPDYATLLPAGKTIQQLGGWGRVSPPDKNPVFAYSDMLASVHIVVSEQPLPDTFQSDPQGQLAQAAKQFNATGRLNTDDGTTVFIGSATNGAQSLVATKSNLLILIRSTTKIGDQQWAGYIQSLQ